MWLVFVEDDSIEVETYEEAKRIYDHYEKQGLDTSIFGPPTEDD